MIQMSFLRPTVRMFIQTSTKLSFSTQSDTDIAPIHTVRFFSFHFGGGSSASKMKDENIEMTELNVKINQNGTPDTGLLLTGGRHIPI